MATLRIVFLFVCYAAIMLGRNGETKVSQIADDTVNLNNRIYNCEVRDSTNRTAQQPQPCTAFKHAPTVEHDIVEIESIYDSDRVRYFISEGKAWVQAPNGRMYEIILGLDGGHYYRPTKMVMDPKTKTLYILGKAPCADFKYGGLFILNIETIYPNWNMQIVINRMEDLGDLFIRLDIDDRGVVQLFTEDGMCLLLTPGLVVTPRLNPYFPCFICGK